MTERDDAPRTEQARKFTRALVDRRIVVLVLLALLAATVTASVVVRNITRDQEKRLLTDRTKEIIGLLNSSVGTTRLELSTVGTAAINDGADSAAFAQTATALTAQGSSIGVAKSVGGALAVVAARGTHVSTGPVAPEQLPILTRALTAKDLVAGTAVVQGQTFVIVAIRTPGPQPAVSFLQSTLPSSRSIPTDPKSPYHDLTAAIYMSPTADPNQILLASGGVPKPGGMRVAMPFAFGADSWLVVTKARVPLVGSFASNFWLFVLMGGLLLTVLVGGLTWVLSSRRAYAMAEVERHTRILREAQEEAAAANRAKSEFISRMSHELRTPLNAVLGFGQLLELYEDLTDEQQKAVENITQGGRHLLTLINEVLDISQVESGRLALSPEPVAIVDVVEETIGLLSPVAAGRSVQLIASNPGACQSSVFADRQRLKQVMLNIVGNAIKYNRVGGTVTIECASIGEDRLRVLVTDTGPGIPAAQLPLLFTPFERLGAERTTIEGTGMGLALSKRLTEAMGGTLGVDSVVGRGSTFWVELPLTEDPVARYRRLEGQPEAEPPRHAASILHIEDNLSNVKLIEQVLAQRPDIELLAAMQASVGLELAREHRPMLILLDLNLPDMSGDQLLTLLREDARTARIPVVVVSADATQRQIQRVLSAGATAYLTKPIDVRELLRLIDEAAAAASASAAGVGVMR